MIEQRNGTSRIVEETEISVVTPGFSSISSSPSPNRSSCASFAVVFRYPDQTSEGVAVPSYVLVVILVLEFLVQARQCFVGLSETMTLGIEDPSRLSEVWRQEVSGI